MPCHVFVEFRRIAEARHLVITLALFAIDGGHVGLAQPSRRFHQRVEHGLQIEGRAADDLQHVGGGGLLLQRLGQLLRARLHLIEQAYISDRDHRLIGKSLEQRDLALGERSGIGATNCNRANRIAFVKQRYRYNASISDSSGEILPLRSIRVISLDVWYLYNRAA